MNQPRKTIPSGLQFTPSKPPRSMLYKTPEASTKEKSDDKRNLKLQLEEVSKEIKKKLIFQRTQEVMLKKVLAFLISCCRRDKQTNALKVDIFGSSGVNLPQLYHRLDKTSSHFLTSRQLQTYFGDVCSLIVFFYGHEGILRFCDFVKVCVPLSMQFEEVEKYSDLDMTNSAMKSVSRLFRSISEAEYQNLKEIEKLNSEFKISPKSDIFCETIFRDRQQINVESLTQLFNKSNITISQLQITLLFRRFDRDIDGNITHQDFSPFIA